MVQVDLGGYQQPFGAQASSLSVVLSEQVEFSMEPADMPWGKFAAILDIDGDQIRIYDRANDRGGALVYKECQSSDPEG